MLKVWDVLYGAILERHEFRWLSKKGMDDTQSYGFPLKFAYFDADPWRWTLGVPNF